MGGFPQNISAPLLKSKVFSIPGNARTLSHSSFVEVGFIPC